MIGRYFLSGWIYLNQREENGEGVYMGKVTDSKSVSRIDLIVLISRRILRLVLGRQSVHCIRRTWPV